MKHWIYTAALVINYHGPEEIDVDDRLSIEELAHELDTLTQIVIENLEVTL